ncbi:uncharacterized protein LOC122659471 [Telopea speciosissima]|uniref:uncharacterized protein LOC122659471 n=1 Tax=Telopea speciosissima TaxID=54955 RepID=UPI001CC51224|nr:uncharacterized protein LOC122659471 [Telopea speciosissima]
MGVFTVKSAYNLLSNLNLERAATGLSSSRVHQWELVPELVWKRIWSLQTLPKIKSFCWRVCAEGVATGDGLLSRQVPIDPSCRRCGANRETADHLLLECPFAKAVWLDSSLSYKPPTNQVPKFSDWLNSWDSLYRQNKKVARESLSHASFLCWYLWRARNDYVFNTKNWTPQEIITVAERAFLEFHATSASGHATTFTSYCASAATINWISPPVGYRKVNCDATLRNRSSKGGLGFIFRDHRSYQVKAISIPHHFKLAVRGEAIVIRCALIEAVAVGFANLQVESDCKEVIDYIHDQNQHPLYEFSTIISDIRRLSSSFDFISFRCIPRAMNGISDALARKALSIMCMTDWPNSTPWLHDLCESEALGCTHTIL